MKPWAALAVCACTCTSGGKGPITDSVAAEAKGPPEIRVRVREHDEAVSCDAVTGLVERVECAFKTKVTTCAWLEVETPELAARPMGGDFAACRSLPVTGPRVSLPEGPDAWEIEVAPDGHRVGVPVPPNAQVFFLIDGVVVGRTVVKWPIEWDRVATLDQMGGALFRSADADASKRLLDDALASGGEAEVVKMLESAEDQLDRWYEGYERLKDEEQRKAARRSLKRALREDTENLELLAQLVEYPDVQPADFQKLLADGAETAIASGYYDWSSIGPVLGELVDRGDPRAGDLACRVYGRQVVSSLSGLAEYEGSDATAHDGALELLSRLKTPCPWVAVALEADPCASELRCRVDGGLPSPDGEDEGGYDPETGKAADQTNPLCAPAAAKAVLSRNWGDHPEGYPLPGPLLLAAAYERGAVSKELQLRNARRIYRYHYLPEKPPPLDPDEEPEADEDEPACQRIRSLPDVVCRLPIGTTEVVYDSCRLRIDDKAHVVRVEQLKAK